MRPSPGCAFLERSIGMLSSFWGRLMCVSVTVAVCGGLVPVAAEAAGGQVVRRVPVTDRAMEGEFVPLKGNRSRLTLHGVRMRTLRTAGGPVRAAVVLEDGDPRRDAVAVALRRPRYHAKQGRISYVARPLRGSELRSSPPLRSLRKKLDDTVPRRFGAASLVV